MTESDEIAAILDRIKAWMPDPEPEPDPVWPTAWVIMRHGVSACGWWPERPLFRPARMGDPIG